ncbi:MAG: DNA mismatch repair protein MutS, partial [Candidatus Cloacimonadota bacterium]
FAYCDISTGDFFIEEPKRIEILDELKRINPHEILISENNEYDFLGDFVITPVPDINFHYTYASEKLKNHFEVETLRGFGIQELHLGIGAAGALMAYLNATQKRKLKHIKQIIVDNLNDRLILDNATVRNLELIRRFDSSTDGTLFEVLNDTVTPMGARILRMNFLKPSYRIESIQETLSAVFELYGDDAKRKTLRNKLKSISDIERLMGRIATERANARDLIQLANSLAFLPQIKSEMNGLQSTVLTNINQNINVFNDEVALIENAIVDNPPLTVKEGAIIKDGFNEELDGIRVIVSRGKDWIANLELTERKRTGIASLKVKYNSVFGYYIEVTKANLKHVPDDYMRKQTLTNCERFITPELKEYESTILGSEEKVKSLEYDIFVTIRTDILRRIQDIQKTAKAIGFLDMLLCFSFISKQNRYSKPIIDESDVLHILEGRHPVVEQMLERGTFIPNNSHLDSYNNQILIITGPNMSGKSTYLRQVGLITIMAQMGCFVPAEKVQMGIVDRVFTRIGASDDLSRGVSTFLAEMIETANILNNATKKSLVILDEVGRGTSTFDGLSIAWSVCEFLHNNAQVHPKTLFATHYHELTELEDILPGVKNYNVSVKRWEDRIIFLRKVVRGGADESYGVDVAKLAGLPEEVIARAKEILIELEQEEKKDLIRRRKKSSAKGNSIVVQQLPLFTPPEQKIFEKINTLDISKLTPIDALNLLNEWKKMLS